MAELENGGSENEKGAVQLLPLGRSCAYQWYTILCTLVFSPRVIFR